MPARWFICPNGDRVEIADCLNQCTNTTGRCLFLPTLRAIAASLERPIHGYTVTQLISGTREAYLKQTADYAVDPQDRVFALHGSAMHSVLERHCYGTMLSEQRLYGYPCSGQIDVYGEILGDDYVLGDVKVSSSFKVSRALSYYQVTVPTDDVYKSGARKGQVKTVKERRSGGLRHITDWAVQLNYYRILLEEHGRPVDRMVIQAICRDYGLQIANQRNIDKPVHLIEVNSISDRWIQRYLKRKAADLTEALSSGILPPPCKPRERWGDRKCTGYCDVAFACDHARSLTASNEQIAA